MLLSGLLSLYHGEAKGVSLGVFHVPITIHLTNEELADLRELTKLDDPAEAVRAVIQDYLRYARRTRLKQLSGRVRIQDNWRELEAAELESQRDTDEIGAD